MGDIPIHVLSEHALECYPRSLLWPMAHVLTALLRGLEAVLKDTLIWTCYVKKLDLLSLPIRPA